MSQAVVPRMEIDCPGCRSRIRLNVHRAEVFLVALNFGSIAALAGLAYWLQSQALALIALGIGTAGMLVLPVLEQTYLRAWPRYVSTDHGPGP